MQSRLWILTLLLLPDCVNVVGAFAPIVAVRRPSSPFLSSSLRAKLWERLEIEEDAEPYWYLINCVAGLEMDLLRQCRESCQDLPDAVKFVVPTERKTRSHGANRMVTETKVKYQGYVFGKLRLCAPVYETIQSLDLCRSWMGTVNHKGHRKLPPAPVSLNEVEVESFGLEEWDDTEEEEEEDDLDESGVILDTPENVKEPGVDQQALKVYLGLKVDDMVKITARGKYFNEDGIVRRLKDGRVFVRFYTYGRMFEDWLDPGDMRKLSNIEILKGLSGPSQPITQRDFDGPQRQQGYDRDYGGRGRGDTRRNLVGSMGGGPRNRRQDRQERNFRRNSQDDGRDNWNWYQDQQRSKRPNDVRDGDYGIQAGSRRDRGGDWAIRNSDSQWGRNNRNNNPQRPGRRFDNNRRPSTDRPNYRDNDNRQSKAAVQGDGDWSAFVSPTSPKQSGSSNGNKDEDDFFASLMSDLSSEKEAPAAPTNDNDDFFDSLLSDLKSKNTGSSDRRNSNNNSNRKPRRSTSTADDDFFASLEAELRGSETSGGASGEDRGTSDTADDFFAQLEAEMSPPTTSDGEPSPSELGGRPPRKKKPTIASPDLQPSKDDEDFFASLEDELGSAFDEKPATKAADSDVFADLDTGGGGALFDTRSEADDESFWSDFEITKSGGRDPVPVTPEKTTSSKPPASETSHRSSSNVSPSDLQKQTVNTLKDMLRERGLKVSGRKAELIERLTQAS